LIDDNYKQFYNEVVDDIKICSIYVDKNNEIENIKQDTLELSRENLITKEEMIKIIKQGIFVCPGKLPGQTKNISGRRPKDLWRIGLPRFSIKTFYPWHPCNPCQR
jgi:hypothetical protein